MLTQWIWQRDILKFGQKRVKMQMVSRYKYKVNYTEREFQERENKEDGHDQEGRTRIRDIEAWRSWKRRE